MTKLERLRRLFKMLLNEVCLNPNVTNYTADEIMSFHNNSYFRNPILDSIDSWEKANKPSRIRIKY